LTAPQVQALYDFLLERGRIKADLSTAMYDAWKSLRRREKEPTARQVAEAAGAMVSAALKACRQFRKGVVLKGKPPGLEPKTVRNVHMVLHAALANAVRWRYMWKTLQSR
jgi:hypothetical protein